MKPVFNYIITIHNKENLLAQTLAGVAAACGSMARIYPVLDGCTDKSEEVVDTFAKNSGLDVRKLHAPDVHMLKTVNTALREIKNGFTIVLQDDVILREPDLEKKIVDIYEAFGPGLGVLSFRLGANVTRLDLPHQLRQGSFAGMAKLMDCICGPDDHEQAFAKADAGRLYLRMAAINGPNCIPESVLSDVGALDENMAPYGHDDPEYCLRAMKAGYQNGVFPLGFRSELDWGGTRHDKKFAGESRKIHRRNLQYIWKLHGKFIEDLWRSGRAPRDTTPWAPTPSGQKTTSVAGMTP